jgi:gas vesicle protein
MSQDNAQDKSYESAMTFFTGLAAGALIGTGLGLLFAPWKGVELRGQMANSASTAGEAISSTVDGWTRQGAKVYERARDVASRAGDAIDRVAGEAAKTVEATLNVAGDLASGRLRRADTRATEA